MSEGMNSRANSPDPRREHLPDPRSRHHPQYKLHQRRMQQKQQERQQLQQLQLQQQDQGDSYSQRNHHIPQSPRLLLQHHPSHPDYKRYFETLTNSSHALHPRPPPQSPQSAQQQYQAYNPNQHQGYINSPLRRVASVERGLGLSPKPKAHRMSRMKSFGDRDKETNRAEELGFPPRKKSQSKPALGGALPSRRDLEGPQRIYNGRPPPHTKEPQDYSNQFPKPAGGSPLPKKLNLELGGGRNVLPPAASPTTSRPASSRSKRESTGTARSVQSPTQASFDKSAIGMTDGTSRNGGVNATPGLKMPIAFSSLARDRGFSTSSQQMPAAYHHNHHLYFPSPRPSNSAPDLAKAESNNRSHRGYGPESYYAQRRQPYYNDTSQPPSSHPSPHNSMLAEDARRPALSGDRDSTVSSSGASSNYMTVDECIGMYASDTDNDGYDDTARVEEEVSNFHSNLAMENQRALPSALGPDLKPVSPSPCLPEMEPRGAPSPPPSNPLSPAPDDYQSIPSPSRMSEVLPDEAVIPQVEPAPDEQLIQTVLQDSPPTPPLSPPVESQDPMDRISVPYQLPPHINNRVPPVLPYVNVGDGDPVKDTRDRYGFRKQTPYVTLEEYEAWAARYEETLARRRKKWEQLMKESGLAYEGAPVRFPPASTKIKRYIRKGIPPEWRGAAWFWYAGGPAKMAKNPGVYQKLLQEQPSQIDRESIERDLHRTFPDNIFFKPEQSIPNNKPHQKKPSKLPETPIIQALRRVLIAFSIYVPKVGYCQSLNFLAGLLLLFMDEEKAFWMLCIITQQHLPGTHEVNLEGSTADQGVLMVSLKESLPAVWAKIAGGLDGSQGDSMTRDLPPITLCTTPWFMSGFLGTLPIESVLRVWDSWFYEGSKTLFRIALAIFKLGEPQIKSLNDPMEVFQLVQNIPRRLIDAGALLEACFRRRNGFGHLSQEDVDQRRAERRAVYARERARAATPTNGSRPSRDDGSLRNDLLHEIDLRGRFARKMKLKI